MLGPAFYLAGDSFPEDLDFGNDCRERLAPAFSGWVGQQQILDLAGEREYRNDFATRLALLGRVFPRRSLAARLAPLRRRLGWRSLGAREVLIGRSSGARLASVFAERRRVAAVICFSYPFRNPHSVIQPQRFAHLAQTTVPTLIFQGYRDIYGSDDITENYALSPSVAVRFVDAEHGFAVPPAVWDTVAETVFAFLERVERLQPVEPLPFDEAYYLGLQTDVAAEVARGLYGSGLEHFQRCGRRDGRRSRLLHDRSEKLPGK